MGIKQQVALVLLAFTLGGCAEGHVYVMQDPKTGSIKECRGNNHGSSFFPLVQAHTDNAAALSCAKGYEAAGWKRMN